MVGNVRHFYINIIAKRSLKGSFSGVIFRAMYFKFTAKFEKHSFDAMVGSKSQGLLL